MTRNRHPADELADVRAEIRALQEREAELRMRTLCKYQEKYRHEQV